MAKIKPFLYLPFYRQKYRITEGWNYSEQESAIHGMKGHGGVDFNLPRGTEVVAAADGYAIASYSRWMVYSSFGRFKKYQGKAVSVGYGYFVQIYHPQTRLFSCYGHLEKTAPEVPFHRPRKIGEKYWPVGHKIRPSRLPDYKWATEVKKGQLIGWVGDSGLTWGYLDYPSRLIQNSFLLGMKCIYILKSLTE